MNPFYYRIKCSKCDNIHIEYKIMNEHEKYNFKCAVCSYKLVGIAGHIVANIYVKCSVCKCIFFNKYDYVSDNIKCPMDVKQSKRCDICETTKNDVVLRWKSLTDYEKGIFLCCNTCLEY